VLSKKYGPFYRKVWDLFLLSLLYASSAAAQHVRSGIVRDAETGDSTVRAKNDSLVPEQRTLKQVVVTALGIKRDEKALGYAVQKITGEEVQRVKGVDIATSLTGKVAGLLIQNSTEFFEAPAISLRGGTPLLVINGVPYGNMTLRDISPDDIESIDVLKGSTAAALYGQRGGEGVLIITTKKSGKKGITVSINSNTMFNAGFLTLPEVQHNYSAGLGGTYSATDYIWGDRLDIGRTAVQWDPVSKSLKEMPLTSRGRDNFKNFLEPSFITNNNISVTQTGENGSFRVSLTDIYNKGQYPNAKGNMINFSMGGEIKAGSKFNLEATVGYSKRKSPQIWGSGYGNQGYIYNLLMWTGPEYDIRQFRDYWVTPGIEQNWMYKTWYDNPYLIAYEKLNAINQHTYNASLSAGYTLFPGARLQLRSGMDHYSNEDTKRNPININSTRGGYESNGLYMISQLNGFSVNNDLLFTINKKAGNLGIDGLAGGTIFYFRNNVLTSKTRGGLSIPGLYSLASSVERPDVIAGQTAKQVNSVFGKLTLSWKSAFFVDVTGRNDWSSTLPKASRSYFYPSVGASTVLSELFKMPNWISFWKVRGSWALSKGDLGIYATNRTYATALGVWEGLNTGSYPDNIFDGSINPKTARTWEVGTMASFLKNRLQADITYYNKYNYNQQANAEISSASGFTTTLVNTNETYVRRGVEITISGTPVIGTVRWDAMFNWSASHEYYKTLDKVYSSDNLWTKAGERRDAYVTEPWEKDPQGNVVHQDNGLPLLSNYPARIGYMDPSWIWGFTNSIAYRNFVFSFSFDGRVGGLMYEYMNNKMWDTGAHPESDNQYRYDEVVNHRTAYIGKGVKVLSGEMKQDNYGRIIEDTRVFAKNDIPVSYEAYAREFADGTPGGALDPTFLKLREVSLQYKLPVKILGAGSASVAFTGQNVLIWMKQFKYADPDKGRDDLNSPSNRYIGMNIKLTF
jgi:TonB-linked SusC/RagA family outer membrane protein